MPTTVANLITALDVKLWGYQDAVTEAQKILALNAGKEKVWLALHAAGREESANWFAGSDPVTIDSGTRFKVLDAAVVDVLSVEAAGIKLHPAGFHKAAWRSQRENATAKVAADLSVLYWLITGSNPATLEIGHELVSNLTVTVYSTKKLAAWSASGNIADTIPEPHHDAVANSAAWNIIPGVGDLQAAALWQRAWQDDLSLILGVAGDRQIAAGTVTKEDYASR